VLMCMLPFRRIMIIEKTNQFKIQCKGQTYETAEIILLSSSSSLKFLEWPKQQRHHEDHYNHIIIIIA